MGIFGFGKKKTTPQVATLATTTASTATTTPNTSTGKSSQQIKLTKSKEDLSNVVIKLTKESGIDLSKMTARVVVVMDDSGSMDYQYKNGTVQNILTRLLPFALQFDDNGELEVYLFSEWCKKISPSMTEANYETYVKKYIDGNHAYGGTNYAPAIKMTDDDYNDNESKRIPTLVFFITDGANWDRDDTDKAIIKSSKHGIFYMFIGTGDDSSEFDYLRELDDLKGRKVDNTGFMQISDLNSVSNTELFLSSLKDYIPWLKAMGYVEK